MLCLKKQSKKAINNRQNGRKKQKKCDKKTSFKSKKNIIETKNKTYHIAKKANGFFKKKTNNFKNYNRDALKFLYFTLSIKKNEKTPVNKKINFFLNENLLDNFNKEFPPRKNEQGHKNVFL